MGFAPPIDGPPPAAPGAVTASAAFPPAPTASICGFAIKYPTYQIGINIPSIQIPPKIPLPFFKFALSCDLANPIQITAGIAPGGGRVSSSPPDPDHNPNT